MRNKLYLRMRRFRRLVGVVSFTRLLALQLFYGLVAGEREPVMARAMKYLLVTLACLMMRASARGNS